MQDLYEEARKSGYNRDDSLKFGYYSPFKVVRVYKYSSVAHLEENYSVVWNEIDSGIIWEAREKSHSEMTKREADIEEINAHRKALDYPPFTRLSDSDIRKHIDSINTHSQHGNDPFMEV